jgi:hypothetical protein
VQLFIPVFAAGGSEEEGLVRQKIINAHVMRCLQSALTFHRANWSEDPQGVGDGGRATLVVRRNTPTPCIGEALNACTEGKTSTRSEMERSAPTRQVKGRVTPKQRCRCSHLHKRHKNTAQPSPIQLHFLRSLSVAMHQMMDACKEERAVFPGAKARHGVVISEAQP